MSARSWGWSFWLGAALLLMGIMGLWRLKDIQVRASDSVLWTVLYIAMVLRGGWLTYRGIRITGNQN
ncbi:MAG: hypothetical protein HOQ35_07615 [Acidobacteriaceae bacterium]|nr:hypothetical protein [Acidobacteriaceae bacterium]